MPTGEASGHPNIRATHRKTLELTRDLDITARATCVVGVGVALDEEALAELHGRVALTLAAGSLSETVTGRLNPAFQPGDPLILRRAPAVTRDAVVIDADRAAADLPRSFVAALTDRSARIAVTVEVLAGASAPGVLVVRPAGGSAPVADVTAQLAEGRRVTVEVDLVDAEARAAIHAAHDAGHTVLPAPGLSLPEAVRAMAGLGPDAEVTEDVPAERLATLLERAARDEAGRGAIVLDPGTPREEYLPWRAGARLEIPGARGRKAAFAVGPAEAARGGETARGGEAAHEAARARARALADAGGSTRDVARLLQDAGLPHRRAYELALDLTADTSRVSRPEPRTSR